MRMDFRKYCLPAERGDNNRGRVEVAAAEVEIAANRAADARRQRGLARPMAARFAAVGAKVGAHSDPDAALK